MATRKDKQKISIIISVVFVVALVVLALVWMIARGASDRVVGANAPVRLSGERATLSPGGVRSDAISARDAVHKLVDEGTRVLVDHDAMSLDDVMRLKKELDGADKQLNRGKYEEAMNAYGSVESKILKLLDAQANKEAAEQLDEQLSYELESFTQYMRLVPVPYKLAVDASDDGKAAVFRSEYSKAVEFFELGLKQLEEAEKIAEDLLEIALKRAAAAIDVIDLPTARESLAMVLQYHPENAEALRLQVLLRTLETLAPRLSEANRALEVGDYEKAIRKCTSTNI